MTHTPTQAELSLCPFCGELAGNIADATQVLGVYRLTHRCSVLPTFSIERSTVAQVIAAWSTRAHLHPTETRCEGVDAAIDEALDKHVLLLRDCIAFAPDSLIAPDRLQVAIEFITAIVKTAAAHLHPTPHQHAQGIEGRVRELEEALRDIQGTLEYCIGRGSFSRIESVIQAQIKCCYKSAWKALAARKDADNE